MAIRNRLNRYHVTNGLLFLHYWRLHGNTDVVSKCNIKIKEKKEKEKINI